MECAWKIKFIPNGYEEEVEAGQIECSQRAALQRGEGTWHIRVTCSELMALTKKVKRRNALRQLIMTVDFASVDLFEDTLTRLSITRFPTPRRLHLKEPSNLWYYQISEDERRIRYPLTSLYTIEGGGLVQIRFPSLPSLSSISLPAIAIDKIKELDDINGQVFLVQVAGEEGEYIHKTLDRPWYEPSDTIVFEQEIHNTLLLRGIPNVGQLIGVTVGKSIYLTAKGSDAPGVIHGMLFEYYPGGTIKQVQDNNEKLESWQKWPLQIARALRELHRHRLAHMDVKPSNIVLDAENNAVIIDLSGQSITYEWLAPELREKEDVLISSINDKIRGELWTLGKLFSELIIYHTGSLRNNLLSCLAKRLMHNDPALRIPLDHVISGLESLQNNGSKIKY